MASPDMTYQDWLDLGMEMGYCNEPHCYIHEGTPLSELEFSAWHQGVDFCVHAVRLKEEEGE